MTYAGLAAVIALTLAGVTWSRVRTGEYLSPFSVVVVAWGATFGLFLLRFLPYVPMTSRAGATMGLGVFTLLAGIVIGERLAREARPRWTSRDGAKAWLLLYAVLGLCGAGWYLWLVNREVGWHALFQNARLIRIALVTYQIPSGFLFLQYFCIVTVLVAVALQISGERLRWWHWAAVSLCLAATWFSTDRTQFFSVFLTSAFMILYKHGRSLGLARVCLAACGMGILLAAYFVIIGLWVGKTPELLGTAAWYPDQRTTADGAGDTSSRVVTSVAAKGAAIYLYATGAYPAFSVWSGKDRPYTWGLEAIFPIARGLKRAGLIDAALPPSLPEPSVIIRDGGTEISFNAYTFLYYPMHDFGIAGVALYPLLVGAACGAAYARMRRARDSALHLLVVAQASTALALSVFVNKFSNTAAWYIFTFTVMPFLLSTIVQRRRARVHGR